ncbi:MAG: YggS family pyridoxal phosphate enzyme [Solirubrobacterales bacterium]
MVEPVRDPDPAVVAANLARIRDEVGPDVEILVAGKYVPAEGLGALAEAGVTLIGENRLQDLEAKRERWGDTFTWDFIGALQSRKVDDLIGQVRLIHSVASDSALRRLERFSDTGAEVLIQVDVAGEASKSGFSAGELSDVLDRCPVRVGGLMTMPPAVADPEASRPHFARLRELAEAHGLARLSMGTSQDYRVAAEEGATIIRLGSALFASRE